MTHPVQLDLEAWTWGPADGDNDLVISVSETFGGWGIQARLTELAGITLDPPDGSTPPDASVDLI